MDADLEAELERLGGTAADVELMTPAEGHGRVLELIRDHSIEHVYILPAPDGYWHFAYMAGERRLDSRGRSLDSGASLVATKKPTVPAMLAIGYMLDVPLSFRRASFTVRDTPREPVQQNPFWGGDPTPKPSNRKRAL